MVTASRAEEGAVQAAAAAAHFHVSPMQRCAIRKRMGVQTSDLPHARQMRVAEKDKFVSTIHKRRLRSLRTTRSVLPDCADCGR